LPVVNKPGKMTASELEVALAKIDINRHEAIDMLGSLGKSVQIHCVLDITDMSLYIALVSPYS